MVNYEKIFALELKRKLVEKIKGKIWVSVKNDELHIDIKNGDDVRYETYLDDFANQVLHGLSTDYVAYGVIKRYRKFILDTYMK